MATNSQRNQLVLTLIRNLDLAPTDLVSAAATDCERNDSPVEDHLLELGVLSHRARSTLREIMQALVKTHFGVDETMNVLSTDDSAEIEREKKLNELSETVDLDRDDRANAMTTPHARVRTSREHASEENSARFRVLSEHARGGLGKVFRAFDKELKREVALKEMQDRFANDRVSRRRFVTEAEVTRDGKAMEWTRWTPFVAILAK